MNKNYFGTDGIRGPVDGPVLHAEFIRKLGAAAGYWLNERAEHDPALVVIGRDTRRSGEAILAELVEGLGAACVEVIDLGVVPTPVVAKTVRDTTAELGIVITASHNPASDNGIKFFAANGLKLDDADELAIERFVDGDDGVCGESGEEAGSGGARPVDALGAYREFVLGIVGERRFDGMKVVVDGSNGAASRTTPEVFAALGAEVAKYGCTPDGENINAGLGSEYPEKLAEWVIRENADIGIAHDGDGDRVVICDERGSVLDGDEVMAILADAMLKAGRLKGDTLVATVMSNLGLDNALKERGGRVERVPVGDRNVAHRMREGGFILGGEASGHFVIGDRLMTGDGLVAALEFLCVLKDAGGKVSDLRKVIRLFPLKKKNLRVAAKPPLEELLPLQEEMKSIERELAGRGRILVRYSGTEPKIRLLVEAEDEVLASGCLERLEAAVRSSLEVI